MCLCVYVYIYMYVLILRCNPLSYRVWKHISTGLPVFIHQDEQFIINNTCMAILEAVSSMPLEGFFVPTKKGSSKNL